MALFDSQRAALILIDLQGANASQTVAPNTTDEVVERCLRLIDAARVGGALVIYVRTSFLTDESDSLGGKLRTDVQRPAKPSRPSGWDSLLPSVTPYENEPIVIKRSWNAFHGSDLDLQLRRHGVDTVVMAGISTGFGVEGTGRAAYDHAYNVVYVPEAMSSYTLEQHEHSIREIFPQIGRVRALDETVMALQSKPAADA